MGWGTQLSGSGGLYGTTLFAESTSGIHSTNHEHLADQLTVWTPPTIGIHDVAHAHVTDNLAILPQVSLLRNLDAWHRHRANKHFFRFDFVLQEQFNDQYPGQVQFAFTPESRAVGVRGFQSTTHNNLEIVNLAQGLTYQGLDSFTHINTLVGFGFYYQFFSFTRTSSSELPIQFEFTDIDSDQILIHVNVLEHTAEQCNVGLQIPITIADAAHAHNVEHTVIQNRSVLGISEPLQAHTADQPRLKHLITFQHIDSAAQAHTVDHTQVIHRASARSASTTHAHSATQPKLKHTSPLASHPAHHSHTDSLTRIRSWSWARAADASHTQSAETLSTRHWSLLAISHARQYHRAQRLNFLPADWVFRAVATVAMEDRALSVAMSDRTALVPMEHRSATVELLDRDATVAMEDREANVPASRRKATVIGRGNVSRLGG